MRLPGELAREVWPSAGPSGGRSRPRAGRSDGWRRPRRRSPSPRRRAAARQDAVLELDVLAQAEGVGVGVEVVLDLGVVREVGVVLGHREVLEGQLVLRGVDVQRPVGAAVPVGVAEGPVAADPVGGLEAGVRHAVVVEHLARGEPADPGSDHGSRRGGHAANIAADLTYVEFFRHLSKTIPSVYGEPVEGQQGAVAVVFGGASGIGAAITEKLVQEGYDVHVADLAGVNGSPPVDVTDEDSVQIFLEEVVERAGPLDLVVNSAGSSTLGLVTELAVEEWRRVVDVCLTGGFIVLKHAGRLAARGRFGGLDRLAQRASAGHRPGGVLLGQGGPGDAHRGGRTGAGSPTDAGQRGLARARADAAHGAGPGDHGIEDDYLANTPLGRAGHPEEVAEAVLYLARAAWVTGEVLDVNGGAHLMRYPDIHGHVLRAFG